MIPLASLAAKLQTVPAMSFPRTTQKLDRMLEDGSARTAVVTAIVASDPLLTALIMGRANATAREPSTGITPTLLAVGLRNLRGILADVAPIPTEAAGTVAGCWSLANATAVLCRILARQARLPGPPPDDETLHAAGLLHDLGTAMAAIHWPEPFARAQARVAGEELPFAALLKQELGADPSELGTLRARAWHLPPAIAAVIRHHPRPAQADPAHQALVTLVHAARCLAKCCGFAVGADLWVEAMDETAAAQLDIRQRECERAIAEFFGEWQELELYEGFLGVPMA